MPYVPEGTTGPIYIPYYRQGLCIIITKYFNETTATFEALSQQSDVKENPDLDDPQSLMTSG
jgi:hypothetical protein